MCIFSRRNFVKQKKREKICLKNQILATVLKQNYKTFSFLIRFKTFLVVTFSRALIFSFFISFHFLFLFLQYIVKYNYKNLIVGYSNIDFCFYCRSVIFRECER